MSVVRVRIELESSTYISRLLIYECQREDVSPRSLQRKLIYLDAEKKRIRCRNSIRRCGEETGVLIIIVICAKETGRPLATFADDSS